jgi:hypothetical protein
MMPVLFSIVRSGCFIFLWPCSIKRMCFEWIVTDDKLKLKTDRLNQAAENELRYTFVISNSLNRLASLFTKVT